MERSGMRGINMAPSSRDQSGVWLFPGLLSRIALRFIRADMVAYVKRSAVFWILANTVPSSRAAEGRRSEPLTTRS